MHDRASTHTTNHLLPKNNCTVFCCFLTGNSQLSHVTRKLLSAICEQQRCRSVSAHLRSLISAFVVRCLDSIVSLVSIFAITLAGLCSWAGRFESYLVGNPQRQVFSWRGSTVSQDFFKKTKWKALIEPPHAKTNNVAVCTAKTQISLGIRPVWSESSLSAWRKLGSLATHWAHSFCWFCHEVAHFMFWAKGKKKIF